MASTFTFDPQRANVALATMAAARGEVSVVTSDDFRQAAMAALVSAEELAAKAGFAVPVDLGNGQKGFVIGGAADKARALRTNEATLYLAAHNQVRAFLGSAQRSNVAASPIPVPTIAPLAIAAIVIAVVGVAAIAAKAFVDVESVQAQTDASVRLATMRASIEAAKDGLLSGQQLSDVLATSGASSQASKERFLGALPWIVGAVGVGALAVTAWWKGVVRVPMLARGKR